jgi:hypothetical protein
MTTLNVDIDERIKRALRLRALEQDLTLSEATTQALTLWLAECQKSASGGKTRERL